MANLSQRNFQNAIALQRTILGGITFKAEITKFQREDMAADASKVVKEYNLKGKAEAVGKGKIGRRSIDAAAIPQVAKGLPFAGAATFNFAGQADLKKVAAEVLKHLQKLSAPFRLSGRYTKSHRIVEHSNKGNISEFIAVSTDVPYAAKLERPRRYFRTGRNYRVYQRTATWAAKRWLGVVHVALVRTRSGAPSIELTQFKGQSPYSPSKAPKWPSRLRGRRRRRR